jgi:hypothetical protein
VITATVKTWQRFPQIQKAQELRLMAALNVAAAEGAAASTAVARRRRRTGKMSDFEVIPAYGDVDGYSAGWRNDPKAWWERFQNDGTLSHRSETRGTRSGLKPLKAQTIRRRSTPSGQTRIAKVRGRKGIEPLHFFEAGRTQARKALNRELGAH